MPDIPGYEKIDISFFPDCCMTCESFTQEYEDSWCMKFDSWIMENGSCPLFSRQNKENWLFDI